MMSVVNLFNWILVREETQNEENVAKEGKNGGYYSVSPPKHKRMMHSQSMSEVNPPSNFLSPISKSNKKGKRNQQNQKYLFFL